METRTTQDTTVVNSAYAAPILLVFLAVVLYLLGGTFIWGSSRKEVIRCSNYKTQGEAQQAFNGDPVKYAALDSDNDLKPCEDLPKQ